MADKKNRQKDVFAEYTTDNNTIIVSPDNPLVINETSVTYSSVEIKPQGIISTAVQTTVIFETLTKSAS